MKKHDGINITVRISIDYLKEMDSMVENNLFGSRSSIIRRALKEFFDKSRILS